MIINVNVVILDTCRVSKCSQIIQKVLEFVDEDKTPFGLTYVNIPNTNGCPFPGFSVTLLSGTTPTTTTTTFSYALS